MVARLFLFLFAVGLFDAARASGGSAIATSSNGFWGVAIDQSPGTDEVSKKAIQSCLQRGGTNPRIVATSWGGSGHGALAESGSGSQAIFGWVIGYGSGPMAGGYSDKDARKEAEARAIANCKKRGGLNPQIVESW